MDADTARAFLRIERKVDQLLLGQAIQRIGELNIMANLDDITAQVAANTDAEQSAVILLGNLHDLLVAAGTDTTKLAQLRNQLAGSKDALAAAIVANTPAADPAPQP